MDKTFEQLSIAQACALCLYFGQQILTYLHDDILCENPLEQRRLKKYSAPTLAFLDDVRRMETRATGISSKRIILQGISATTEVSTVSCGRQSRKIKTLFKIDNLKVKNLKKLCPEHLVYLLMAIIYRCLLNLSDRSLAMPNDRHSCRVSVLIGDCVNASIIMKKKLKAIFSGIPFHSASTKSEKKVHSISVKFALE
jgi:hypothetical protein